MTKPLSCPLPHPDGMKPWVKWLLPKGVFTCQCLSNKVNGTRKLGYEFTKLDQMILKPLKLVYGRKFFVLHIWSREAIECWKLPLMYHYGRNLEDQNANTNAGNKTVLKML